MKRNLPSEDYNSYELSKKVTPTFQNVNKGPLCRNSTADGRDHRVTALEW
jgi:hypothetical protein